MKFWFKFSSCCKALTSPLSFFLFLLFLICLSIKQYKTALVMNNIAIAAKEYANISMESFDCELPFPEYPEDPPDETRLLEDVDEPDDLDLAIRKSMLRLH